MVRHSQDNILLKERNQIGVYSLFKHDYFMEYKYLYVSLYWRQCTSQLEHQEQSFVLFTCSYRDNGKQNSAFTSAPTPRLARTSQLEQFELLRPLRMCPASRICHAGYGRLVLSTFSCFRNF